MAEQYANIGPIYTTAEKYEAARTAGTLEVGREYRIVDWEAQEKINDLDTIRSGAALGATAIQEHQSLTDYRKYADQDTIDNAIKSRVSTIEGDYLKSTDKVELATYIANKVDKPEEPVEGQGVNVPYYFSVDYEADKAVVKDYTIDLINKLKTPQVFSLDINAATTEKAGLMKASDKSKLDAAITEHQDISGKLNILPTVDDPTDPGYGYPYWIPYSFATTTKADGLDVILKTLTLDNTLRKMNFTNAFPVASSSQAGIMTAADKIKLDAALTEHQDISGKQDVLTAGTGIKLDNNTISIDDGAGIAIYDSRISDANSWLTNGYTKTSAEIPTANLPPVCTGDDRWGVLLYVAENNENKAGLQQYFPIDGTYKGRVFYRSVTGYGAGIDPDFGDWNLVPWSSEKQDVLTASTGIDITGSNIKSVGVEYKDNETTQSNALKFVRMTQAQYDALATKDADTLYIIVG